MTRRSDIVCSICKSSLICGAIIIPYYILYVQWCLILTRLVLKSPIHLSLRGRSYYLGDRYSFEDERLGVADCNIKKDYNQAGTIQAILLLLLARLYSSTY